jgi:hypothetical protein
MKFGKHCEEACSDLAGVTKMPAFPYKDLKKQLKHVEESTDPREEFFSFLINKVRNVDEAWKKAAHAALKAERSPYAAMLLATAGLGNPPDAKLSQSLDEWASVARTGLRKIKKWRQRESNTESRNLRIG